MERAGDLSSRGRRKTGPTAQVRQGRDQPGQAGRPSPRLADRRPSCCMARTVRKTYKTFLATYKPAGGLIRVVLVKESAHWVAYFCTKADASVAEILEAVADRSAIEQNFHDLKEVHGAGQQQLRNYWANIAAYHVTLWWHTLIEVWAWHKPHEVLTDRSASPWDDADPSTFARRSP